MESKKLALGSLQPCNTCTLPSCGEVQEREVQEREVCVTVCMCLCATQLSGASASLSKYEDMSKQSTQ